MKVAKAGVADAMVDAVRATATAALQAAAGRAMEVGAVRARVVAEMAMAAVLAGPVATLLASSETVAIQKSVQAEEVIPTLEPLAVYMKVLYLLFRLQDIVLYYNNA
jgi:hypothetical protein